MISKVITKLKRIIVLMLIIVLVLPLVFTVDSAYAATSIEHMIIEVADTEYDGEDTQTQVAVFDSDKESYLIENTDYTLTYSNNDGAGTATVTISGIGEYEGETSRLFTIKPIHISKVTVTKAVTPVPGNAYDEKGNRKFIITDLEVRYMGKLLTKGVDYSLSGFDLGYNNENVLDGYYHSDFGSEFGGQYYWEAVGSWLTEYDDMGYRPEKPVLECFPVFPIGIGCVEISGIGNYSGYRTESNISIERIDIQEAEIKPKDIDRIRHSPEVNKSDFEVIYKGELLDEVYWHLEKNKISDNKVEVYAVGSYMYVGQTEPISVDYNINLTPELTEIDFINGDNYPQIYRTVSGYGPWHMDIIYLQENDPGHYEWTRSTIYDKDYAGYTGEPIEKEIKVYGTGAHGTFESEELIRDKDYTVAYINNIDRGIATVIVTGKGKYEGQELRKNFTIGSSVFKEPRRSYKFNLPTKKEGISPIGYSVRWDSELTDNYGWSGYAYYTGSPIALKPIVYGFTGEAGDAILLEEGRDYTLSYLNNTNLGKATAIVEGIGRFAGERNESGFYIVEKPSKIELTEINDDFAYTGKPIIPSMKVTSSGYVLKEGENYTATYYNNVKPGTAHVLVEGKGLFEGLSAIKSFHILETPHEHKLHRIPAKEATETESGNVEYYQCTICNRLFEDKDGLVETDLDQIIIEALGEHNHILTKTAAKAATCTTNGNKEYYTCSSCKKAFADADGTKATTAAAMKINATGHNYGAWTKLNASQHHRVCQNNKSHVEKANHTWDSGKITKKATEEAEGIKTYTCTVCKATKTEAIHKLTHTHKIIKTAAKAATCTTQGNKEYYTCSRCNKVFSDAKGTKETTADAMTIKATGHKYGAWTKLNATQHQRVCQNNKSHVEKANHTWDKGKVTKAATITATGVKTYNCTLCKATKTESIAKLPVIDAAPRRIYGSSRYQTSFAIAEQYMKDTKQSKLNGIIVACGLNFPDALAASYLAKAKNIPVIVWNASKNSLVQAAIKKNVKSGGTIYLLGGPAVVGNEIKNGMGSYKFQRIEGANRYETNTKVLEAAGFKKDEVLVCDGSKDGKGIYALIASGTGKPIILAPKGGLTDHQKTWLARNKSKITKFTILGNTSSVDATVERQLKAYGKVTRMTASNADDLSAKVARVYFKDPSEIVIATMDNFPDGLCGGPLALANKGPVILVNNRTNSKSAAYTATLKNMKRATVLGGNTLVSDATVKKLAKNSKAKWTIVHKK